MGKRTKAIAVILCMLVLLTACGQETASEITESQVWETMPPLTYGEMKSEKLEMLPWYSGRAEAVGKDCWAETEDGFYRYYNNLRYMDRDTPALWVPVCNKPNCTHPENSFTCNAYSGFGGSFVIRNGRIYIRAQMDKFPELCPQKYRQSNGLAIFSRAMNGTDMRMEYMVEDDEIYRAGAGGYTNMLSSQCWIWNVSKMNPDGTFTATSYCLTNSGLKILFREDFADQSDAMAVIDVFRPPLYGDFVFYNYALGDKLYGIRDGDLYEVDAAKYADGGGYLSGNVLRQFRAKEGYYDIDLETGEEAFLCAPRLENSTARLLLPNCIIETTLGSNAHPAEEAHAMEIFDGQQWNTVILPEDVRCGNILEFCIPATVASDRIIFNCGGEDGVFCYQVKLGQEKWVLEPFGQIS